MRIKLDVVQGRAQPRSITIEAQSVEAAKTSAHQLGYTVLSATTLGKRWLDRAGFLTQSTHATRGELVLFVEQLSALLQAGLSVIEVLETLSKGANAKWAAIVEQIVTRLREGQSLSIALEQTGVFPSLLVAMVHSAELTSDLPQALNRFLDHEKKAAQVRHQLTSVALYPVLLIMVGGSVMLFLLLYVMPRFARVFESMHDLPWSAQLMVDWSHLLKAHGTDLLVVLSGLIGLGVAICATPSYRSKMLASVLRIPLLARYLRTYFLTRWYRTIGMLVEGGIPLPESLHLANQVLPQGLRAGGAAVEKAMREGQSPSSSFGLTHMATAVAQQLLRAGERSGDVGAMLTKAAAFHENEITKALDNSMRIVEPLVMTLIGLGVGLIVVLMYLPIFELASAIQ